ncbi:hypothetical protein CH063_01736 [Colletotrichum higginsianum]|uniref:MARVEL domain-containing protein n=1 Tax=Colletotrichum higginsianum (strain IMI 349063) TaxID=759273 RepID=H1VBQ7_COLHI|nr:hypothetical protein CH063_01736 [Colletotrichum higginsianum]
MGLFGMAASYLAFSVLHFFQFVLAVTVCGLYAVDLNNARSHGDYTDGKWVFAVVVGTLSAVTALLYFIPFVLRFAIVWVWDAILFILWIAVFGLFGSVCITHHKKPPPYRFCQHLTDPAADVHQGECGGRQWDPADEECCLG